MYYTKKGSTMLEEHRGASTEFPENTIPAFRAAKEQGYDAIELDLAVTKDGVVVFIHDSTVNRTARTAVNFRNLKKSVTKRFFNRFCHRLFLNTEVC